jgi:predicted oxidoreductase
MKKQRIAGTPLEVSRIVYGCMGLSGNAVEPLRTALDSGIDMFDHADIYGKGKAEEAFSAIWQDRPGLRDQVVIQSKCGIRFAGDPVAGAPGRYDFSREHILRSVEGSLRRLKTDYLDILLLHRPDALVEPEEVASAFDALHFSGKVRYFGVSNHSAAQIELLRHWVTQPLVVNQLELNLVDNQLFNAGITTDQRVTLRALQLAGTVEYCRLNAMTIQAWSPLAHGAFAKAEERVSVAARSASALAEKKGVTMEAILIAWILRHPAGIQPILGTTRPERIRAACAADGVELSREDWYELFGAGRGAAMP